MTFWDDNAWGTTRSASLIKSMKKKLRVRILANKVAYINHL